MLTKFLTTKQSLLPLVILIFLCVLLCIMYLYKNQQPHTPKPPHALSSQGYVFALDYYDQHSNGLYRLLSLQCWAGSMKMLVVEPFLPQTVFGVGNAMLENKNSTLPMRFSDVYDIDHWNRQVEIINPPNSIRKFAPLIHWEEFLHKAPRKVVLVNLQYEAATRKNQHCTLEMFSKYKDFWKHHNFTIHRSLCIELALDNNLLTHGELGAALFPNGSEEVTMVFSQWKGILQNTKTYKYVGIEDSSCYIYSGYYWTAELSPSIRNKATAYIRETFTGKFIAVMIRTERSLAHLQETQISVCIQRILQVWKTFSEKIDSNSTFVALDVGKYGTSTLAQQNQNTIVYINSLLSEFYGHSFSLKSIFKRQEMFANFAPQGASNPSYVALLEKAVATSADCLLLVGGGVFQEHAVGTYKKKHSHEAQCITVLSDSCT